MVNISASIQLPLVTEDDLRNFHSEHFPSNPHPHKFFYDYSSNNAYAHENGHEHDAGTVLQDEKEYDYGEEDNLGYYPDGVKRTLTDEQIAMFRHTEIQMLLRERRRLREEEEEEEEEEAEARKGEGEGEVIEAGLYTNEDIDMGIDADQHAENDIDLAHDRQTRKEVSLGANNLLQADAHPVEPETRCENGTSNDLASLQSQSKSQSRSQKKRSRTKNLETKIMEDEKRVLSRNEDDGNIWNFRRRARELDEKEEQRVELDY